MTFTRNSYDFLFDVKEALGVDLIEQVFFARTEVVFRYGHRRNRRSVPFGKIALYLEACLVYVPNLSTVVSLFQSEVGVEKVREKSVICLLNQVVTKLFPEMNPYSVRCPGKEERHIKH